MALLRRMRLTRTRTSTAGIIWPLKTLPSNDYNLCQVPDTSVIMGQDFPQLLPASSLMTRSPSKTHNHNHNNPTLDLNFLRVTVSSAQLLLLDLLLAGSTLACQAAWKWLMSLEEHNMASKLTLTSTRGGHQQIRTISSRISLNWLILVLFGMYVLRCLCKCDAACAERYIDTLPCNLMCGIFFF